MSLQMISMGAPVYDSASQSFVGMFDVRDILSCVTAAHREYIELGGHKAAAAAVVAKHSEDIHQANDLDSYRKIQGELLARQYSVSRLVPSHRHPGR